MSDNDKNPHAVELSKLGAAKGRRARARALDNERRVEIARQAARTRWNPGEPARAEPRNKPSAHSLQQQLDAANQRIAELEKDNETAWILNAGLQREERTLRSAKQAAERKLATTADALRPFADFARLIIRDGEQSTQRDSNAFVKYNDSALTFGMLKAANQALAQIEQPPSKTPRLGTSALTKDLWWCECGRGLGGNENLHNIHERWRYCPHCGSSLNWSEALAQIEQPQDGLIPGSKIPWSDVRPIEQPQSTPAEREELVTLKQQLPGEPDETCQCQTCRDTRRLDWLEANYTSQKVHIWPSHQDGLTKIFPANSHRLLSSGASLREAIDGAIAADGNEPHA